MYSDKSNIPASTGQFDLPLYSQEDIQSRIFTVRGVQVMLDRDLARLYQVETKALNQAVKRNKDRFPERYMFQLTKEEWAAISSQNVMTNPLWSQNVTLNADDPLKSQNVTLEKGRGKHVKYLPYVFTEQGVTQLSAVLRSKTAIEVSIRINDAFHAMRRFISANAGIFQRLDTIERHQIATDQRLDHILDQLEEGTLKQKAHIFSAGQIFEAKSFIESLIGKATTRVILVDGYLSSETIDLLDARPDGVAATIYTSGVGPALRTLMQQYRSQYPNKPLDILKWAKEQHDRWLILDDQLWHVGASIKDAGVKTFGIDPIGLDPNLILTQVSLT